MLDAAIAYLNAGLTPVPVKPRAKSPTLVPWGQFQTRRPTEDEVMDWWTKTPDANVALVTGNGLLVIDLDGPDAESLLSDAGIELPFDAPRVRTGRLNSGEHVWLRIPNDLRIRPKVSLVSGERSAVDLRCDGAIALVPPSLHPSGQNYVWSSSWDGDVASIPLAPPELLDLITKRYGSDVKQVARMADEEFAELIQGVGVGERNQTCARLAGKFFAMGLSADNVASILEAVWAPRCTPPMPMIEVRNVVHSIERKRLREQGEKEEKRKPLIAPRTEIEAMRALLQQNERKRILASPWTSVNRLLGDGFRAGEYILLGARPGTGKTAFALQCAWHAAQSVPVLFVTLEMSIAALNRRMFSQMTGVPQECFEDGSKSKVALDALDRIEPEVRRMMLMHSDQAFTVGAVNEACTMMRDQGMAPGMIVIDYLQLLRTKDPTRDRRQAVESISRDLVRLSKAWDCPLMVLSALTRPQEAYGGKTDTVGIERPPTLASLRESGQLEHDADLVILMHRKSQESTDTIVNVAKHRDGGLGTISLPFDGPTTRFADFGAPQKTIEDVVVNIKHYTETEDDVEF